MNTNTVCITIVCLNRLDCTKRTLAAFVDSAKVDSTPFNLFLVDNGSTDATPEYLAQFKAENPQTSITIIRLDKPTPSISEAVNRGWFEGRECGYFVKLDNDIIPNPGWLGRLKAMLDAEAQFGQVGICVTASPNGDYWQLGSTRYFKAHRQQGVDFVWGACMMVRADVLRRVGVLHEGLPRDEDREFSARIIAAGYTIAYLPDGERCQHIGPAGGAEGNPILRAQKFARGSAAWMGRPSKEPVQTRWGDFAGRIPPAGPVVLAHVEGPNVAMLLPTRGRPAGVTRFLQSLCRTTNVAAREHLSVWIYCDDDDAAMRSYDWAEWANILSIFPRYGARQPMNVSHNCLAAAAKADLFFVAADDLVARTPGWYARLAGAVPTDGIAVLGFEDGRWGRKLMTHPIITRRLREVLGYVVPEHFKCDRSDSWMTEIGNQARRLVWVDGLFEHMHWMNGKREKDQTDIENQSHLAETEAAWTALQPTLAADCRKVLEAIARASAGGR